MKQTRHAAARRGWSNRGGYKIAYPGALNPPRQGCRWNDKEKADLVAAYQAGSTVGQLAKRHQRTYGAIGMQLERSLSDQNTTTTKDHACTVSTASWPNAGYSGPT